jgi:hypothetical protein
MAIDATIKVGESDDAKDASNFPPTHPPTHEDWRGDPAEASSTEASRQNPAAPTPTNNSKGM